MKTVACVANQRTDASRVPVADGEFFSFFNVHCVQKKTPLRFSSISPWKMFGFVKIIIRDIYDDLSNPLT